MSGNSYQALRLPASFPTPRDEIIPVKARFYSMARSFAIRLILRPVLLSVALCGILHAGGDPEGKANKAATSTLPSGPGLAAGFTGDMGIDSHPDVIFADSFESTKLGSSWDEQTDPAKMVLSLVSPDGAPGLGKQCLRVVATLGKDTGGGLTKWFKSSDRLFIRFHTRFAADCDYVHHFVTLRAKHQHRPGAIWLTHRRLHPLDGGNFPPGDLCGVANQLSQKKLAKDCADWISRMVEIKSIVRAGFLHGKMYHIQDGKVAQALLGSSNFTVPGLGLQPSGNNIELNLIVSDDRDRQDLLKWFNGLWNDKGLTTDVKEQVLK